MKIESAVSVMQTVIELGRVVRDRNTLPLKVGTTLAYSVVIEYKMGVNHFKVGFTLFYTIPFKYILTATVHYT